MIAGPEHVQTQELRQAQLLLVCNIAIIVSILIVNINIQAKWEQDPNMCRLRNLDRLNSFLCPTFPSW